MMGMAVDCMGLHGRVALAFFAVWRWLRIAPDAALGTGLQLVVPPLEAGLGSRCRRGGQQAMFVPSGRGGLCVVLLDALACVWWR